MGQRIEICGGIAAGKTTLAVACEPIVGRTVRETFAANPFFEKFYTNPIHYAFETEITFLLQHYSEVRDAVAAGDHFCCDFAILQDLAYAQVNLCKARLNAFEAVWTQVHTEIGPPSLLVHLTCGPEEQLHRIRGRKRQAEAGISLGYLKQLNHAITQTVSMLAPETAVLNVDTEAKDFANDPETRSAIVTLLANRIATASV